MVLMGIIVVLKETVCGYFLKSKQKHQSFEYYVM